MSTDTETRFAVTFSHASVHAPSMDIFEDLAKGFGMDVDCTYDVYNDETVYRYWVTEEQKAKAIFAAVKDEMKAGEVQQGTVRMLQTTRLKKWGH